MTRTCFTDGIRPALAGVLFLLLLLLALAPGALAFCGFYVAQGDAKIYNQSSRVVLARDGNRTVLTMASDFKGDPKEFAVVIPVPVVLKKEQVHIADPGIVDRLHDYSVPRLVEYWDPNPCPGSVDVKGDLKIAIRKKDSSTRQLMMRGSAQMVTIEAQFKVDEYDILILSAEEGRALEQWLRENGYNIPPKASRTLQSYIRQGMYFFVAKVNLNEQKRLGFTFLRPIQVAYESPKFMLPIRLGMVNAEGPQEMFVFTLTSAGRVEATNYRTLRVPTNLDVPEFLKPEFPDFYRKVFTRQHEREGKDAIFLEYCWNIVPNTPSCDPCTAPYLRPEELLTLGAFWISPTANPPGEAVLTRLHLRYDRDHFPEDLQFQVTKDRENWQARYVLHHPYSGTDECPELAAYRKTVWDRRHKEAQNYCELTGDRMDEVRTRMGVGPNWSVPYETATWWERIWKVMGGK
jgi:hypothetical protein